MKKCKKCQKEKDTTCFFPCKSAVDGLCGSCRGCILARQKERYSVLSTDIEWRKKKNAKAKERLGEKCYPNPKRGLHQKKNRSLYPEKCVARKLSEKIKAPEGMVKHHWSYRKEDATDVVFVTPQNHAKLHMYIVYDQERRMYRHYSSNILLCKADHIAIITSF